MSTDELGHKMNAIYIQNHDILQSVHKTKLMKKSKIVISTLIRNVKDKYQGNNVDVLFSTLKAAADELRYE